MMILLGLSVVAVAIILVKLLQFWRAQLKRTRFIEPAIADLARGERDRAVAVLRQEVNPVARVMETAINANADSALSVEDRDAEIARVGTAEIRNVESYLRGLEIIANVSPLLGLLGTVLGMILAFQRMEAAGPQVDPSVLSSGIWRALLTTALGLGVAVPVTAVHGWLERKVERVATRMNDAVTQVFTTRSASDENLPE